MLPILVVTVTYTVLLLIAGFGLAHLYYATSMDHGRLNLNQALHVHQHNYSGSLWFLQKSASTPCFFCLFLVPLASLVLWGGVVPAKCQPLASSLLITWPLAVNHCHMALADLPLSNGPCKLVFVALPLPSCLDHMTIASERSSQDPCSLP